MIAKRIAIDQTEALLARVAVGDGDAKAVLLDQHRDRLRRIIQLRLDPKLRTRFDASDVIQETLMIANSRLEAFAQSNRDVHSEDSRSMAFFPWLRGIAMDKLLNLRARHRAAKRDPDRETQHNDSRSDVSVASLIDRLAGKVLSPSQCASRQEDRQLVRNALDRLPHRDREVIELRYLEHLEIGEISSVLGITSAAVRTRHFRAIQRLHAALKPLSR